MENNLGNKATMAKNIKRYMEIKGKKPADVYTDLEIAPATFSDWMHGRTYPRIDKIEKMANYFEIAKADLVEESTADSAIKSARMVKKFEKLTDRDKQIVEDMIDNMIISYTQ